MTDIEQVRQFLNAFKTKARIFGIVYRDDRHENEYALAELEISHLDRDKIILGLKAEDFSETIKDTLNKGTDLWVFGKVYKKREIYIKITLGRQSNSPVCISFHPAKTRIKYQFKK